MTGSLHDVVGRREQGAATKGENDRVGVQGSEPTVAEPCDVKIERREKQLGGDDDANQHADDAPDNGH